LYKFLDKCLLLIAFSIDWRSSFLLLAVPSGGKVATQKGRTEDRDGKDVGSDLSTGNIVHNNHDCGVNEEMEEFVELPYNFVKGSLRTGNYVPSFCSMLLEDMEKCTPQFEFDLKHSANSMYSASLDTTITVFCHFLLAMVLHPEVLAKAQKEIDSVVGTDRLPSFSDRASLPFVDALLSEVYRWGVPVPLSLPHRLMEDDVYRGMFIPKGSLIFGNVWAITRDETLFPNASAFLPERYLEKVEPALAKRRDPRSYVFGFGRRRCPGVNLVESSVWLLITTALATLDISKAKDDFGNIIEPKVDFNNAVFRLPDKFQCDIRPRSEHALKALREADA